MRIGTLLVIIWIFIGIAAAGQRDYFRGYDDSCAHIGTTVITILAGPLNYVGVNPKVDCDLIRPSR